VFGSWRYFSVNCGMKEAARRLKPTSKTSRATTQYTNSILEGQTMLAGPSLNTRMKAQRDRPRQKIVRAIIGQVSLGAYPEKIQRQ